MWWPCGIRGLIEERFFRTSVSHAPCVSAARVGPVVYGLQATDRLISRASPLNFDARAVLHRTFFQEWTNSCRQGSPLAKPSNLPCATKALVASSRRWRHRVRLDEAVISSAEGATLFGLCEPLSPSGHLRTRVAPPPSRRCQSLTTGARGRWSSRLVPVSSSSLATFKEGL